MAKKLTRRFISCLLAAYGGDLMAQTTPDAGALQKQIEQQLKTAPTQQFDTSPRAPKDLGTPRPDLTSFTVTGFEFVGNTQLSNEDLQAIVAPYVGQRLDIEQLKKIADRPSATAMRAGWCACSCPSRRLKMAWSSCRLSKPSLVPPSSKAPKAVCPPSS